MIDGRNLSNEHEKMWRASCGSELYRDEVAWGSVTRLGCIQCSDTDDVRLELHFPARLAHTHTHSLSLSSSLCFPFSLARCLPTYAMPTSRHVSLVQKLRWHVSGNISPTAFAIGDVEGHGVKSAPTCLIRLALVTSSCNTN